MLVNQVHLNFTLLACGFSKGKCPPLLGALEGNQSWKIYIKHRDDESVYESGSNAFELDSV